MKRLYFIVGVILFVGFTGCAVWSMLTRLREPKATKIIKPSSIESYFILGEALYKRLRQEFRAETVYVLGSNSREEFLPLIAGWSKWYRADGGGQVSVYMPEELIEETDAINTSQRFFGYNSIEQVIDLINKEDIISKYFVITKPEVSQLFGRSDRSNKLEKKYKKLLLSFTLQRFAVKKDLLKVLPPCNDSSYLGKDLFANCAAHAFSHEYFYKELDPKKNWVAVEKYGQKNYLIFLSK